MSEKQKDHSKAPSQSNAGETISQHKKSVEISSSKTGKKSNRTDKNIEKTGIKHDDWDDATGNSHVTSGNK